MFTSRARLEWRSGRKGVDRPDYLKELVHEFNTSKDSDARAQVLANLANFAYDPINYPWLRRLGVIDVFLAEASEGTPDLRKFAVAGLCNLALDHENKLYIIKSGGVGVVSECLNCQEEDTVASAITTLMFLVTPQSKPEITSASVVRRVVSEAKSNNPRVSNLAKIFLADYCTPEQVAQAETAQ